MKTTLRSKTILNFKENSSSHVSLGFTHTEYVIYLSAFSKKVNQRPGKTISFLEKFSNCDFVFDFKVNGIMETMYSFLVREIPGSKCFLNLKLYAIK